MEDLYRDLGWLPARSKDAPGLTKSVFADAPTLRTALSVQLSETQVRRVAKLRDEFSESPAFLTPLRVTLLSNANFELLEETIVGGAFRYGLDLHLGIEPMGRIAAAAVDETSRLNASPQDVVIVALTAEYFEHDRLVGNSVAAESFLDQIMMEIGLIAAKQEGAGGHVFVQSIPSPVTNLIGPIERWTPGAPAALVAGFNERVRAAGYPIIDIADLASRIGISRWSSNHYWNWGKLPFHPNCNIAYADRLARSLWAFRGGTRKCLILDLDNTLWRGVIGDDGIDGIQIGNNSPVAEAHRAIQKLALMLKARGIVLAVCSKNDAAVAIEPFKAHSEMLLRPDDFAVFQANWNDKATNIRAIADALSLGTDSFVLLDDNPMERDLVRRELPEVAVPELPGDDPARWPEIIAAAGYFDAYSFTDTDRHRARQYADNAQRERLRVEAKDIKSYLRSLEMNLVVRPIAADIRSRAVQLINRSNQFNLRTRRYSESDIKHLEDDPAAFPLTFRLVDRFGDNGIIAVIVGIRDCDDLVIDTWLMSCRVLQRSVEEACLDEIVRMAARNGMKRLVGEYIPTTKNSMVERHYERLGFAPIERADDGRTRWALEVGGFVPHDIVMSIDRGDDSDALTHGDSSTQSRRLTASPSKRSEV